mgnify:CR=1 FL=1
MGKYIKYEIKGSYKFILGIIAILIISTTSIQLNAFYRPAMELNDLLTAGIPIMIIIGAIFTAFFYIVGSFRKELYEDRGYLTFSLPLSGNQILGSKLIVAALWFFLLGLSVVNYNVGLAMLLYAKDWYPMIKDPLKLFLSKGVGSFIIVSTLSSVVTLIMIYFSMALSRVTVKNKKIGGFWFIIFLAMNSLYGFLQVMINKIFPYYFDFANWDMMKSSELSSMNGVVMSGAPFIAGDFAGSIYYGIPSLILTILVGVAMFYGTSYLIEKKIDL